VFYIFFIEARASRLLHVALNCLEVHFVIFHSARANQAATITTSPANSRYGNTAISARVAAAIAAAAPAYLPQCVTTRFNASSKSLLLRPSNSLLCPTSGGGLVAKKFD
jgi:hypothetical protein